MKRFFIYLIIISLIVVVSCSKKNDLTEPEAEIVTPTTPTTPTVLTADFTVTTNLPFVTLTFDASTCYDPEDAVSNLLVRWDYENDGIYDTEWTNLKTVDIDLTVYSTPGTYSVRLCVMDTSSNTNVVIKDVDSSLMLSWVTGSDIYHEIVISGNYAYCPHDNYGIRVYDISDPTTPFQETTCYHSTGRDCWDVALSGNYAFLAYDLSELDVFNVSDLSPTSLDRVTNVKESTGQMYGLATAGDYLYIANGWGGLKIMIITNPEAPVTIGNLPMTHSRDVEVAGDYAYVADENNGLRIVCITNPEIPVLYGTYDTAGIAYGVAVSGNYVYLADGNCGMKIFNVSDPTSPTITATNALSGAECHDIDIIGNYVFVADRTAGVWVFDVSNPASPVLVKNITVPSADIYAIGISGDYLYMSDEGSTYKFIAMRIFE